MNTRVAVPYHWWAVEEMAIGPQLTLYYRLGDPRPLRDGDGDWLRDERGRVALEAFGALPLPEMYARFRAYRESLIGQDGAEYEQAHMLGCLGELVAFVRTFGPLGFDWARTFEVGNPDADRALDDGDMTSMAGAGATVARAREIMEKHREHPGSRRWRVRFPSVGELGLPRVSRARSHPDLVWAERARQDDDALMHDFLGPEAAGPLWLHQEDLRRALRLVDALAGGNPQAVREALGRLPGYGTFPVRDSADRAPVDIDWRPAMLTLAAPASGWWAPFKAHPGQVDWIAAGRLGLATFLSGQLAWTQIAVGLDARARFRSRWIVGSLMEVVYLQLVEHVERRMGFGVGECGYCGGPILRVRLKQWWHRQCANAGRQRRHRGRGGTTNDAL